MKEEERLELIKRNAAEIITEEELRQLIEKKNKFAAYYGIAPTGPFHIGYLSTLSKVFDLENAGATVKILIADIHSALDDLKTPWGEIDKRAQYYKKCIELAFPWSKKPRFILGSDFQLDNNYMYDMLQIASMTKITRAKHAASEVCRLREPKVSEMIYPIMQSLDEQYLDVDIQLGGIDQRHIMAFAREYLPKLGYKTRIELMMPLVASLKGPSVKMSASLPETHIKIYESEENIRKKISEAYCPAGDTNNVILHLCKFLIFPLKGKLKIEREKRYGGDIIFESYEELEKDFIAKKIHPLDIKTAVSDQLIMQFKKARDYFEKKEQMLQSLGAQFLP